MASNSSSIQILMEAEKEADKIVQKGRAYRIQKLKDAKIEALKEIESLKEQKAKEFNEYQKQFAGQMDQLYRQDASFTEEKMKETQVLFEKNKEAVLEKLLNVVIDVQPMMHVNAEMKMAPSAPFPK